MTTEIRHEFRFSGITPGDRPRCWRCGRGKSNPIHQLNARCSVCRRIFKKYQLDASGRCDEDRP